MRRFLLLSAIAAALALPRPAVAWDDLRGAVNGGVFDLKHEEFSAAELGFELQFPRIDYRLIPDWAKVRWVVGAATTSDDAYWGYGGLRSDFELDSAWWLGIGLSVVLFEDGSGLDLGARIEFRSSIEIAREIGERGRLGLILDHLSNASFYPDNPGSESLLLSWSFRLP